jgi:hypothetical protein
MRQIINKSFFSPVRCIKLLDYFKMEQDQLNAIPYTHIVTVLGRAHTGDDWDEEETFLGKKQKIRENLRLYKVELHENGFIREPNNGKERDGIYRFFPSINDLLQKNHNFQFHMIENNKIIQEAINNNKLMEGEIVEEVDKLLKKGLEKTNECPYVKNQVEGFMLIGVAQFALLKTFMRVCRGPVICIQHLYEKIYGNFLRPKVSPPLEEIVHPSIILKNIPCPSLHHHTGEYLNLIILPHVVRTRVKYLSDLVNHANVKLEKKFGKFYPPDPMNLFQIESSELYPFRLAVDSVIYANMVIPHWVIHEEIIKRIL